jgi:hypothetical protein
MPCITVTCATADRFSAPHCGPWPNPASHIVGLPAESGEHRGHGGDS